ncbi:RDD family protein [Sporomusa aerivorans]|uniref:RDD family protein n=1 Tax=Sporomusa aerivorans TaxID=204936 RepID=UPI00352B92F0
MNTPDTNNYFTNGAGVGIRALAAIIDGIILAIVSGALLAAFGSDYSHGSVGGLEYLWSLAIGFCYYTYFEGNNGATPGKMLFGLKVVNTDGTACDVRAAAIRTACRIIDGLFAYLVGAILIWISDRNQRLGDKIAGTLVVKAK